MALLISLICMHVMKTLEVRDLRKSFGNLRALDGVTLDVEQKDVACLIGPNGSGKTTLINAVSGFYAPDSGKVFLEGKDVTRLPPYKKYKIGLGRTFQIPSLFWKLTTLENLLAVEKGNPGESFTKSLMRRTWLKNEAGATERAFALLDLLNLKDKWDTQAFNLSGGQMKLLELGRVLMSGSKLVLLDEPISGINPSLAHEIFAKILKSRDELGVTFLIVEHRLDIALEYVDTITAMASGKVIAVGKPETVMSDPKLIEAYLGG
jgi:branched-chain amino acid transport system ATP-binding protein